MCDCNHCDDITIEISDSETSSSQSHFMNVTSEIDVSSCCNDIKKGVHFKETVEIFLIPSREELLAAAVSVCHKNMTVLPKATCLKHNFGTNKRESMSPLKKVSFLKFVEMIKIPSPKQSTNKISYAVFCLKKKQAKLPLISVR